DGSRSRPFGPGAAGPADVRLTARCSGGGWPGRSLRTPERTAEPVRAVVNRERWYNGRGRRMPMAATSTVVHSDPDILGGTPVFVGTRVPVRTLLDYLEAGDPLNEFLEDFPSVTREQAVAALQLAKQMLVAHAHPA